MNRDYDDYELENTLREHLASELDGQLGRSVRAFHQHLATTRTMPAAPARPPRTAMWAALTIGTALAASLAALWIVPILRSTGGANVVQQSAPGPVALPQVATAPSSQFVSDTSGAWEQVEQVVSTVTLDNGMMLMDDNTPVRLVRRVAMERTQWVDERRGVRIETVVPREKVTLIAMETY